MKSFDPNKRNSVPPREKTAQSEDPIDIAAPPQSTLPETPPDWSDLNLTLEAPDGSLKTDPTLRELGTFDDVESEGLGTTDEPQGIGPASEGMAGTSMVAHGATPEPVLRQPTFPGQPLSMSETSDMKESENVTQNPQPICAEPIRKVEKIMPENNHEWDDWTGVLEAHPGLSYHQGEIIRLVGEYKLGNINPLQRAKYILDRLLAREMAGSVQ